MPCRQTPLSVSSCRGRHRPRATPLDQHHQAPLRLRNTPWISVYFVGVMAHRSIIHTLGPVVLSIPSSEPVSMFTPAYQKGTPRERAAGTTFVLHKLNSPGPCARWGDHSSTMHSRGDLLIRAHRPNTTLPQVPPQTECRVRHKAR